MTTYTVKDGDTLSQIAKNLETSVPLLQSLNTQIKDPNFIKAGWSLNAPSGPTLVLPPTLVFADSETSISLKSEPECGDELVEIIHITGEDRGEGSIFQMAGLC
ncbi:LysM peptidoglycan-binding domain-containing protein [Pseudomonas sp. NPDC098747]|uniref:LysM peptidoglycan-binding domain-containing protein n=1 Tax=Pseudomonas sp. NPDC098747 TaxID=3364487 RepID=UPI00383AF76A